MKTAKQISAELKKLILSKQQSCTTEAERNKAVEDARAEINKKYGKGWREKLNMKEATPVGKYKEPSIYDDHTHGKHWMD